MLTVVCWQWGAAYTAFHVERLAAMVRRHYARPHRFLCVSNDLPPIDGVELIADRADFADLPSPHGGANPSCYRRLFLFHPDAAKTFGDRVVSLDIDAVLVDDVAPLWDRPEDFVGYGDAYHGRQFNGSMVLLRTGSHPEVWNNFSGAPSVREALRLGFKGSDQGWMSRCLAGSPAWTDKDGVISFGFNMARGRRPLPPGARIVFLHGRPKPWDPPAQTLPFVKEHWGTV